MANYHPPPYNFGLGHFKSSISQNLQRINFSSLYKKYNAHIVLPNTIIAIQSNITQHPERCYIPILPKAFDLMEMLAAGARYGDPSPLDARTHTRQITLCETIPWIVRQSLMVWFLYTKRLLVPRNLATHNFQLFSHHTTARQPGIKCYTARDGTTPKGQHRLVNASTTSP